MYGIIYKATGPSGLVYIGQTTKTLNRRKGNHAYKAKKRDRRTAFQAAILEYGSVNVFQWDQIDTAETAEELDEKEKHWIAHYQSDNPAHGYNGTNGGIGAKHTPETRLKLSEQKKGEKSPWYGKHFSEEHRQKLSEANRGQKRSAETRKNISTGQKGKHLTAEAIRKRTATRKARGGYTVSAETRKKISKALKGKARGKI